MAPTTTDDAPGGWQNHDVTVTLAATDGGDVPSGVAATYYGLDGGATQTGTSVTASGDGTHSLSCWSVDNLGPRRRTRSRSGSTSPRRT